MSRGHGSTQLYILQYLHDVRNQADIWQRYEWVPLWGVASVWFAGGTFHSNWWGVPSASARESFRQAAHRLSDEGVIDLQREPWGGLLEVRLPLSDQSEDE